LTAAGTSATTAEFEPGGAADVDVLVDDDVDAAAELELVEDDELLLPHPASTAATPTSDSHTFHVRI
jgi:hypothetical protein